MQQVSWLMDGRIIQTTFSGRMSLAQIEAAGDQVCRMLKQDTPGFTHLLIDASSLKKLPRTPGSLKAALEWLRNPAFGQVILHGSRSATDQVLFMLAARTLGVDFGSVATQTQAMELLAKVDKTLHEVGSL